MEIVAGKANSSFAFWNFFPNIFHPWLPESMDVEPKDAEDQLYFHFVEEETKIHEQS